MNKLLKVSMLTLIISACSSEQVPTPQKLSLDVQSLPPYTVISVIAQDNYKVPKGSQIIEQSGVFRAKDNVYNDQAGRVLIPRGAIITGNYTNDGTSCKIVWKSIYINDEEYDHDRGSFELGRQTQPSMCDPVRGIKKKDRLTVSLKQM